MRTLLRIILVLAGTVILVLLAAFCWLHFYLRDLPDVRVLAQFAPTTVTQVSDPCIGKSTAIPYEAIGVNVTKAISAVETSESDPGVLRATWGAFTVGATPRKQTITASWYISRTMCYAPSRELHRHLAELRTAIQLERHYSRRQLFTIYANRVSLAPGLIGVQQASAFYFHKKPDELTVPEAALLTGLIRAPSVYSPVKHPDRALRRRNEVIDAMVESGSITAGDAESYKSAPLGVVTGSNKPLQTEFLSVPAPTITNAEIRRL